MLACAAVAVVLDTVAAAATVLVLLLVNGVPVEEGEAALVTGELCCTLVLSRDRRGSKHSDI